MGGADAVVEIGRKDAILNQVSLLAFHPFIVQVKRSTVVEDGAIVYHIDKGCGDRLPQFVGKDGDALAVEISLKGMADGFVQENA